MSKFHAAAAAEMTEHMENEVDSFVFYTKDYAAAARALGRGHSNIDPNNVPAEAGETWVALATHSFGERSLVGEVQSEAWSWVEDEDHPGKGWAVIDLDGAYYSTSVQVRSATSGTVVRATLGERGWRMECIAPAGYRGHYYRTFEEEMLAAQ